MQNPGVLTHMLGDKCWERSDISKDAFSVHRADYGIDLARDEVSAYKKTKIPLTTPLIEIPFRP